MTRARKINGYILALAGAALFSSKAIFVKLAFVDHPDALKMLCWRMIFSLPLFVAVGLYAHVARSRKGLPPPAPALLRRAVLVGLIGYYLAMFLDFEGLLHVTAQLERLALFTYPVFLIFIGAMFFGASLTLGHVIAAVVTYAGLACVFLADFNAGGSNVPLGTALVLERDLIRLRRIRRF